MTPSAAFRQLFEQGLVKSNDNLVDLLYAEFEDLPVSVMPTVMNWNRGTNPERAMMGLGDDRLDEILMDLMRDIVIPKDSSSCGDRLE